ncbi:hypothetical protein N9L68_02610, partial [bacterium]|nr:hypothetical protein [bacterium]
DPYWEKCAGQMRTQAGRGCMEASELESKYEEGGYVGRSPPGCKFCNNMNMSFPSPATRVSAWARCFSPT